MAPDVIARTGGWIENVDCHCVLAWAWSLFSIARLVCFSWGSIYNLQALPEYTARGAIHNQHETITLDCFLKSNFNPKFYFSFGRSGEGQQLVIAVYDPTGDVRFTHTKKKTQKNKGNRCPWDSRIHTAIKTHFLKIFPLLPTTRHEIQVLSPIGVYGEGTIILIHMDFGPWGKKRGKGYRIFWYHQKHYNRII